ncbi:MAG: hypothetical protein JO235_02870 [Chroococcidiopsidaceae cyanobacterium CP_BM_RX_35]|nr:hypothetical protein [Chroococcidiopsidaceae cyanobacterium CP_BM_RX_35]
MVKSLDPQNANVSQWQVNGLFYEYMGAVNPKLPAVPARLYPSEMHEQGPTRIIPFDLSEELQCNSPATSPNLSASYLRICANDTIKTEVNATSQLFYVIRGTGESQTESGNISWSQGDVFTLPATSALTHKASADSAIYWVNDSPLLAYLGVKPDLSKFQPTLYPHAEIMAQLEQVNHQPGAQQRNRDAIILGNKAIQHVLSLTHTLWSAVVLLGPEEIQRPHRHNSVAIDIVMACESGCYTLIGDHLDDNGEIINPVRINWQAGAAFVTPPHLWHGHYSESSKPAIVMAVQEAAFYEYMRTLNIEFSHGAEGVHNKS